MNSGFTIKKITKSYPGYQLNVKSMDIGQGQFISILGHSGSGKSTLIRCICGLTEADELEIESDGVTYTTKNISSIRKHIAFVFQNYNLIPRTSVLTNVLLGNLCRKRGLSGIVPIFSKSEKIEALKILESVGLFGHAYKDVKELSGGQMQRVAIARALAQKPKLILADEPISSLDPELSKTMLDLFKKINVELGVTIVANLHQPDFAGTYSDRIIRLKNGTVVESIDCLEEKNAANY